MLIAQGWQLEPPEKAIEWQNIIGQCPRCTGATGMEELVCIACEEKVKAIPHLAVVAGWRLNPVTCPDCGWRRRSDKWRKQYESLSRNIQHGKHGSTHSHP